MKISKLASALKDENFLNAARKLMDSQRKLLKIINERQNASKGDE